MSTPQHTEPVSHGRGGLGNVVPDDTKYVDGSITRQGPEGSHKDGAYSAGRGGAANISDVGMRSTGRVDKDNVPEAAVRPSIEGTSLVGRGGAGNLADKKTGAAATTDAEQHPKGLADKLKERLFGVFKK